MADDEDVPEGENPFAAEGGASGEGGDKTKSESAYEKKGWIAEDRDYQYGEVSNQFMLQRQRCSIIVIVARPLLQLVVSITSFALRGLWQEEIHYPASEHAQRR